MTTASISAREGTAPTERELEVLRAWRAGGSSRAAAKSLGMTVHGVEAALANVRSRAGVRRTWEAALTYLGSTEVGSS